MNAISLPLSVPPTDPSTTVPGSTSTTLDALTLPAHLGGFGVIASVVVGLLVATFVLMAILAVRR